MAEREWFEEVGGEDARLSEMGEARRGAMLGELIQEMERVQGRRRAVRQVVGSGIALGVIALVVTGAVFALRVAPRQARPPVAQGSAPVEVVAGQAGERARMVIEVVRTRADAGSAWRVGGAESGGVSGVRVEVVGGVERSALAHVVFLGDRELVAELARIERPAGLIRLEGRVILTAAVTDAERQGGGGSSDG